MASTTQKLIGPKTNVMITGCGALTSLGLDVESSFKAVMENRSGVKLFPEWKNYVGLHSYLGAPVSDYQELILKIPRAARRSMSRMSEMGTIATFQALQNADLSVEQVSTPRTLVILGSTTGSPQTFETYFKKLFEKGGPEGQFSTSFFKVMNHSVAANVASAMSYPNSYQGGLLAPSCACATSSQAMILGWELIQAGLYDIVIAGGADELHYTSTAVFDIVMAASRGYHDAPEATPRPFDKKRDGLVVSEGAAVCILESEQSMIARKGRALAKMSGGAYLCDGSHMTQSSSQTMEKVMKIALERADIPTKSIGYVNAHATGTVQGDQEEAQAIGSVFGKSAAVSSLKAHFGHSLAACGALEAICSIKMLEQGRFAQTRNLESPDPACGEAIDFIMGEPRTIQTDHVLSNNFAFGGMNTSLVVSRA